jgi:hypothetical protein
MVSSRSSRSVFHSADWREGRDLEAAIATAAHSRQHVRVISASGVGIRADGGAATFWVPDPDHNLMGVRLCPDRGIPDGMLDFRRSGDGWKLAISQPPVSRMEYLVELRYPDGSSQTTTDPGNPQQAAGAFGPKSVLEFPSYTPPGWLTAQAEPGRDRTFAMASISTGYVTASACCWCAVRASGKTPPGRWTAPGGLPGCWPARASGTNSTCGAMTCPMTGHPGAPSWPITCRDSAENRRSH